MGGDMLDACPNLVEKMSAMTGMSAAQVRDMMMSTSPTSGCIDMAMPIKPDWAKVKQEEERKKGEQHKGLVCDIPHFFQSVPRDPHSPKVLEGKGSDTCPGFAGKHACCIPSDLDMSEPASTFNHLASAFPPVPPDATAECGIMRQKMICASACMTKPFEKREPCRGTVMQLASKCGPQFQAMVAGALEALPTSNCMQ